MNDSLDSEKLPDFPWAKEGRWLQFEEQLRSALEVESEYLETLRRCRGAFDKVYVDTWPAWTPEAEAFLRVHLHDLFGALCDREFQILRLETQIRRLGGTVEERG